MDAKIDMKILLDVMSAASIARIRYTNHRGETADRRVIPFRVGLGSTPWHPDKQWLLEAYCLERKAPRHFALSGISEILT